jgi:hypothetical protein
MGATQTSALTNPPGFSSGAFGVSDGGAATHSIPIAVPPGANGMQPGFSLVYNSQAGNGVLGMGWLLSGISSIERCPATLAQDGFHGGVNHDPNDRFCLDGQRLIAISGTNGADGTEYRTEIDSFAKIVSYGAVAYPGGGYGPEKFQVWTKGGAILEFGYTAASRILLPGTSSVHKWALNRKADRYGNYYDIVYDDLAPDQILPVRIDYTGNAGQGVSPTRSVQLVYEARPDPMAAYAVGAKFENEFRL